jgi:hypothetical protein
MVVRVDRELQGTLAAVAERLFTETRLEHSKSAIVRGLITIGLIAIAENRGIGSLFAGSRIPRGRKRAR